MVHSDSTYGGQNDAIVHFDYWIGDRVVHDMMSAYFGRYAGMKDDTVNVDIRLGGETLAAECRERRSGSMMGVAL